MPPVMGNDKIKFEAEEGWAKLPAGWNFHECPGVAVDASDNVYVFTRGQHPIIVFDKNGNFVRSWGEGAFSARAHGINVSPDGFVYVVDDSQHCIKKFTTDGKLLMTIGKENEPAPKWGGQPFNRPTHMAVSPNTGEIYITDGYGNARVHRYDPDGRHILSWGGGGVEPGEFQRPHNVVIDKDENVYIADRENHRVQVFDKNGKVQAIWQNIFRPDGMCMDNEGHIFIGELNNGVENDDLGHRICVYNTKGERLARFGDAECGDGPTQFVAPHGCAVDSQGNLYVGDVAFTMYGQHQKPYREMRSFQKLRRVR